jgi:hypothetical protein
MDFGYLCNEGIMSLLGAVIGIANTQAWVPPANGIVKDGWALCNGQTFSGLGAGNYDVAFSGNLPNINNNSFIMGWNAANQLGGTNSYFLLQANLPPMTSGNETAGHSHVVSGRTTDTTADHVHWVQSDYVDRNHRHYMTRTITNFNAGPHSVIAPEATYNLSTSVEQWPHSHSQGSDPVNADHSHAGAYTSAWSGVTHTHTYTNASQSSISNLPPYISCHYVMAVSSAPEIPLGTVVAIANSASWTLPSNGQVKDGWALCNGQTFSGLGAGNYNAAFTGNLPQLSDDRFLMGAGSTYATGGISSYTLVAGQLPSMSASNGNSQDHYHTGTISTTGVQTNHSHTSGLGNEDANHAHNYGYVGGALYNGSSTYISNASSVNLATSGMINYSAPGSGEGPHWHGLSVSNANGGAHVISPTSSVTMGWQNVGHAHDFGTASNTAVSRLPKYLKCVYIMRVS